MKRTSVRHAAVRSLQRVLTDGRSLDSAIAEAEPGLDDSDRPFHRALLYGVLRQLSLLEHLLSTLLSKPLKKKDRDIHFLLLCGLFQIQWLSTPSHAVVNESVKACLGLKKNWARNLVNAVLRNALRSDLSSIIDKCSEPIRSSHPDWLYRRLQAAWPDQLGTILEHNNLQAPMWLRVNLSRTSREACIESLAADGHQATAVDWPPSALRLEKAASVTELAGFSEGLLSVQDCAAQCAAMLLAPRAGDDVLDVCAAPGGKSVHLMELENEITLTCLDIDPVRLQRVQENLDRAQQSATLLCADGMQLGSHFGYRQFDRILLDAPCSATGVIRRHPDIKWLRSDDDIARLSRLQFDLLTVAWQQLRVGGRLLYATCSVLPDENEQLISAFVAETSDACVLPLDSTQQLPSGIPLEFGIQILPGEHAVDGFYYALLEKQPAQTD